MSAGNVSALFPRIGDPLMTQTNYNLSNYNPSNQKGTEKDYIQHFNFQGGRYNFWDGDDPLISKSRVEVQSDSTTAQSNWRYGQPGLVRVCG